MRIFDFLWRDKRNSEDYTVSIEMYRPVITRITMSLQSSNIEEGGKFLGTIHENRNQIAIRIYSYIDAGPRVSNSRSHIIPDGEHQENLFRIIEGYDADIEHIGSWHSHHSNGLQELSHGDIEGYYHNVNDRNYNLDWFFVMLITSIDRGDIVAKYYLFHRGEERIYTISNQEITILNQEYKYENILREVEQSTYIHRNQHWQSYSQFSDRGQVQKWEKIMMGIRADDRRWIENNFRSHHAVRNRKDNSIKWRWNVPYNGDNLEITYTYPRYADKVLSAMLTIKYREKEVLSTDIKLDDHRYDQIANEITKAKELLSPTTHQRSLR